MTTLIDIYEAAGGKVNEDRTMVQMNTGAPTPFEIVLKVVPGVVEMDGLGNTDVTFHVLLDDRIVVNERAQSVSWQPFISEVKLPVEQVRLLKADE